jgi:putative ABC transport system permease protein
MHLLDSLRFSEKALVAAGRRSVMMMLAMAVGVASVVILSSLADSARLFVSNEFSSLGSNLVIILPGKTETTGQLPPIVGHTPEDLTMSDSAVLQKLPRVSHVAPVIIGSAPLSHGSLEREVTVIGSTSALLPVRNLSVSQGRFLPHQSDERGAAVVVIGSKLRQTLFGSKSALGEWVRINDRRFRVIGVLAPMGESLGIDMGDLAVIPVADAQQLFNTESLFRILLQARDRDSVEPLKQLVNTTLSRRHHGKEDFTVITQQAVLSTFDDIFISLGYAVTGIAAISLAVAGVLIMNVMLIAVSQRQQEIGLLKALGGSALRIRWLFMIDALLLSLSGALLGLFSGYVFLLVLRHLYPEFPLNIPAWSVSAALLVALSTGLLFGTLPASRAARLDPVQALRSQR